MTKLINRLKPAYTEKLEKLAPDIKTEVTKILEEENHIHGLTVGNAMFVCNVLDEKIQNLYSMFNLNQISNGSEF